MNGASLRDSGPQKLFTLGATNPMTDYTCSGDPSAKLAIAQRDCAAGRSGRLPVGGPPNRLAGLASAQDRSRRPRSRPSRRASEKPLTPQVARAQVPLHPREIFRRQLHRRLAVVIDPQLIPRRVVAAREHALHVEADIVVYQAAAGSECTVADDRVARSRPRAVATPRATRR